MKKENHSKATDEINYLKSEIASLKLEVIDLEFEVRKLECEIPELCLKKLCKPGNRDLVFKTVPKAIKDINKFLANTKESFKSLENLLKGCQDIINKEELGVIDTMSKTVKLIQIQTMTNSAKQGLAAHNKSIEKLIVKLKNMDLDTEASLQQLYTDLLEKISKEQAAYEKMINEVTDKELVKLNNLAEDMKNKIQEAVPHDAYHELTHQEVVNIVTHPE